MKESQRLGLPAAWRFLRRALFLSLPSELSDGDVDNGDEDHKALPGWKKKAT